MAGVVVDGHHLNKSLREWRTRLDELLRQANQPELKSSRFYYGGSGISKKIGGEARHGWIGETLLWIVERRMKVALTAVDRELWASSDDRYDELPDEWLTCGLHLALQLQKAHQTKKWT